MAYTKTIWKNRQGTGLNRFIKSGETTNAVYLENEPDSITEPGTNFSSEAMNHIEEGIEAVEAQIPIIQKQDVYGYKTFGLFVKEGIVFSGKNNILLQAALQNHAGISERRLATWGDVLYTITGNPDSIKP
jgi:hypothetical protein